MPENVSFVEMTENAFGRMGVRVSICQPTSLSGALQLSYPGHFAMSFPHLAGLFASFIDLWKMSKFKLLRAEDFHRHDRKGGTVRERAT